MVIESDAKGKMNSVAIVDDDDLMRGASSRHTVTRKCGGRR